MNNGQKIIRKYDVRFFIYSVNIVLCLKKVKAVTVRMDDLISRIKSEHKSYEKLNEPIAMTFYSASDDADQDQSTTGLNGHFVQFLLLFYE